MPRKAKESKDYGDNGYNEITLSIALLGGLAVILLKVIDYSSNQSLEFDSLSKPPLYFLIGFLLIELLIILLFFIFKGISVYTVGSEKFEQYAGILFKFSFIFAFGWIIASILTVFFKLIYSPKDWYGPIVIGYVLILLITVVITVTIVSTYEIKTLNKIKEKFKNSPNYLKNIFILIVLSISLIIFFVNSFGLVSQYLLTGSYSIEEFSDNADILTFTMKEKGISYDLVEVKLYKLNSSRINNSNKSLLNDNINNIQIYRNNNGEPTYSDYLWGANINTVWYLNIINISNLSSGTYLLHVEVKNNLTDNSVIGIGILERFADKIGVSKRTAEKLFYIPPKTAKANYSSNCTQTS